MPHCTKCGAAVAENAAFCAGCGSPVSAAPAANPSATPPVASPAASQQMSENVAGLLCYVLAWVTGLIFYFIDKRPYVRFHASQSIVLFGGLHIVYFVLAGFFGFSFLAGGFAGLGFAWLLYGVLDLVAFILWILLMIKAYQGERFRVPVVADLAEKIFGKN
jgi:uncharacterized membrane protein